jgi:hypothetical protein
MNSRPRAFVLLLLLVLAWGSVLASPFRAFAELCRTGAFRIGAALGLDRPVAILVAYFVALLVLIGLLVLSRSKGKHFTAPFCALAALAYNLILSALGEQGFAVAFSTSISLALALLFMLPKSPRPAMWLGDAFTMAIPAMVLFDAVVMPAAQRLSIGLPHVKNWLDWGNSSLVSGVGGAAGLNGFLGLDLLLWSLILFVVFLIPTLFLTVGRPKG